MTDLSRTADELHLRFELTESDIVGLKWVQLRRSISRWKVVLVIATLAVGAAIGLIAHQPAIVATIGSYAVAYALAAVLGVAASHRRARLAAREALAVSPVRTIDIGSDGIREESDERIADIPWTEIIAINRNRSSVCMLRTLTDGYVLPRRAFYRDTEYDEVFRTIQLFASRSKNGANAGPTSDRLIDTDRPGIDFRYSVGDVEDMIPRLRVLSGMSRAEDLFGRTLAYVSLFAAFLTLDWSRLYHFRHPEDAMALVFPMISSLFPAIGERRSKEAAREWLKEPAMTKPQSVAASAEWLVHRVGAATLSYRWSSIRSVSTDWAGLYIRVPGDTIGIPLSVFAYRTKMIRYADTLRAYCTGIPIESGNRNKLGRVIRHNTFP